MFEGIFVNLKITWTTSQFCISIWVIIIITYIRKKEKQNLFSMETTKEKKIKKKEEKQNTEKKLKGKIKDGLFG